MGQQAHSTTALTMSRKRTLFDTTDQVPEVFLEDTRQHEHLHVHSLEHVTAAGHAGTVGPGGQLWHGQICAVAVVVAHDDGTRFASPAVDDVAGACVGLKPRALRHARRDAVGHSMQKTGEV